MGSNKQHFAAQSTRRLGNDESDGLLKIAAPTAVPADPPALRSRFSKPARTVALRRHQTLRRFNRLRKRKTATAAARIVRTSLPTLWRWQKRFDAHGIDGLKKHSPPGRKPATVSPFDKIKLSARALQEIEALMVNCSSRAAWRQFAANSVECPQALANYIAKHGRPPKEFSSVGRVQHVQGAILVSADGARVFVKIPSRAIVTAKLSPPPKFKFLWRRAT